MRKPMTGLVALGWAVASMTAGCATHTTSLSDLPSRDLAGHYTGGDGESWFRPCGAPSDQPSWWVTFTGASVRQADQARAAGSMAPGGRSFVRWRAAVTLEGEVGPHGEGVPAVLVREILEVRPAADGDCAG